jgi:hypothetical protein
MAVELNDIIANLLTVGATAATVSKLSEGRLNPFVFLASAVGAEWFVHDYFMQVEPDKVAGYWGYIVVLKSSAGSSYWHLLVGALAGACTFAIIRHFAKILLKPILNDKKASERRRAQFKEELRMNDLRKL